MSEEQAYVDEAARMLLRMTEPPPQAPSADDDPTPVMS